MTKEEADDLARRRKEDFDFMVLCAAKRNMAMYHLLRDRTLDDVPKQQELFDSKKEQK